LLGHGRNDADMDVFVIHSYIDKTLYFATCDSDEHCSMDATVTPLYVE